MMPESNPAPVSMSTEAMRDELLDLQARINHLQPQLDRVRRKSSKTTEKLTRERNLTSKLIALYQRKKALTEMIPTVSTPIHSTAGPPYQNGYADGFIQHRHPLSLVQPPIAAATISSGSNVRLDSFKDEPMDTDSDNDDAVPPPIPNMNFFGDDNHVLAENDNVNTDFYQHNTAKADEWALSGLNLSTR